jgi:urease accessory protein
MPSADVIDAVPHPREARAPGACAEHGPRAARCLPAVQRPPAAGAGTLAFARVDGATALVRCRARSPLQLLVPRRRGLSAWAFLATHGGGLVAGDRIDLEVDVGEGAAALIASQAEAKVYRADGRGEASLRLAAAVGERGVLALLPDPVSPFAGARYAQRQRFDLAPGASLALVDALAAGRSARGERWAFASASFRTEIAIGGRLALADGVVLAPGSGGPLAARLGRFGAFATAVALGPAFAAGARALLAAVGARPVARGAALLANASPLADGVLLRAAAASPEELQAFLRGALAFTAGALGDDPFARRW